MDEQPVQLVKETRAPVPAAPGRPRRVDYEYERAGTANLFVFSEPRRRRISIRGDSYRLKDKLKSGVVKPTTVGM